MLDGVHGFVGHVVRHVVVEGKGALGYVMSLQHLTVKTFLSHMMNATLNAVLVSLLCM